MQRFLAGVVLGTKAVLTRVELGGTLLLAAVIGVLLTSRDEKNESPPLRRSALQGASFSPNRPMR